jgi:putative transcriptional regulator
MVWGSGLGRKRSRIGKMADYYRVAQTELNEELSLNRETVSRLCSEDNYNPRENTKKKIIIFFRQFDEELSYYDLF